MIQEWRSFLGQAGAFFDGDQIQHFGHPQDELAAANFSTLITDLSHLGLITVQGEDATSFLQNILTNDVGDVSEKHSQLTGLCNPKGRLFVIFQLFQRGGTFYLSLPRSLLEVALKKLNMYVLRSQVVLTDASDHFCRFGLAGPQASNELKRLLGDVPAMDNEVYQALDCSIIRMPGEPSRFEIVGELSVAQSLWSELSKTIAPVGTPPWKLLNIRAGIPTIYPETQETFIPQQVNLELRGGVSLTKGCYPGQEVIARMHYRGKPSRRMFLVHIATDKQPQPGESIYMIDGQEERSVGEIVDAQRAPEEGYDSLVVVQLAHANKDNIRLGSRNGAKLIFRKLPYEVPT